DPDLFDPRRFLDRAATKVDRYAYLPFGIGPRMCIGAGFALQEATLMLATIMKNFTLALAPGQSVWPLQRFTLRPRDPLLMSVQPRESEQARLRPSRAGRRERRCGRRRPRCRRKAAPAYRRCRGARVCRPAPRRGSSARDARRGSPPRRGFRRAQTNGSAPG